MSRVGLSLFTGFPRAETSCYREYYALGLFLTARLKRQSYQGGRRSAVGMFERTWASGETRGREVGEWAWREGGGRVGRESSSTRAKEESGGV